MSTMLFLLLVLPINAASKEVKLDPAPIDTQDAISIQRGAQLFVNYCLSCHSAIAMRYNRLQDLGLTERQIKENLIFGTHRPGAPMSVAMRGNDAKEWFGVAPPDLSVVARSRGPDWLYTYLRSFYRDTTTATGWNNLVFPNVAMPHVLWQLQGQQVLKLQSHEGEHGTAETKLLAMATPGQLSERAYDRLVADLVNYFVFMGEPVRELRIRIGYAVLIFLGVLFVPVYLLKKEYWKDLH